METKNTFKYMSDVRLCPGIAEQILYNLLGMLLHSWTQKLRCFKVL